MIRRLQVSDPRFARLRAAVRTEPRVRATVFVLIAGVLTAIALLIALGGLSLQDADPCGGHDGDGVGR